MVGTTIMSFLFVVPFVLSLLLGCSVAFNVPSRRTTHPTTLSLSSSNYLSSLTAGQRNVPPMESPTPPMTSEHVQPTEIAAQDHPNDTYEDSFSTSGNQRRPIMAGNWKLNPETLPDAVNLLKLLASNFWNHRTPLDSQVEMPEVVVFPPFPYLPAAISELEGTGIKVGAQNIALQSSGAFTGEVAASMISSLGCDYVMLGHSERRALFKESDADINKKVHLSLDQPSLGVILCVGESEEEYENNLLKSVVEMQIKKGLMGVVTEDLERIVIAYEPVWAIGTGKKLHCLPLHLLFTAVFSHVFPQEKSQLQSKRRLLTLL